MIRDRLQISLLILTKSKRINLIKKNFMALFYEWGLQPLREGSLLFTIQFPATPGTHFIDLRRIKG